MWNIKKNREQLKIEFKLDCNSRDFAECFPPNGPSSADPWDHLGRLSESQTPHLANKMIPPR